MANQPKRLTDEATRNVVPSGPSAQLDLTLSLTPPPPVSLYSSRQADLPGDGEFMGFANREPELEEFLLHPKGQHYLFDAPAGYGKTCLLRHVGKMMEQEKGFRCVYVDVSQHSRIKSLAVSIAKELVGTTLDFSRSETSRIGLALGAGIANQLKGDSNIKGICLLFDVDHSPDDGTLHLLRVIVEDFLPVVYHNYQHNSPLVQGRKPGFQVAIAGRYLNSVLNEYTKPRPSYVCRPLKPFNFKTVEDIVERVVGPDVNHLSEKDAKTDICADFAADLLFFSGGHPGCIAEILEEYRRNSIFPQYFFTQCLQEIQEIVQSHARKVRESIPSDLRGVVEKLCVYRNINASILDQLIETRQIDWSLDGFSLMKQLRTKSIVGWQGQFRRAVHDDILFNMLLRLHAIEGKFDLESAFQNARTNCERELRIAGDDRSLWAVDVWYYYLAARMTRVQYPEDRLSLRKGFFEQELQSVLVSITVNRDGRQEFESLLAVLDDEQRDGQEFRFLVNYFLRGEHFSNQPYAEMQRHIETFFQRTNGR